MGEQRCVGIERELRRVQEAAESCGLAIQNHVEDARSSWDRLSKLEVDINEIQATRTSLAAEPEKMRKVVVSDLIRLAKDKVRTKEDLGMYHFSKTLDQDTGHKVRESTDGSGESGKPEAIVAVAAGTTFVQVVAMRSSDSYELQRFVWDAVLFLGVEAFHWHEQLFLILAYLINFILQSVFCMMVVHLGTDFAAMDDDSLKDL